VPLQSGRPSIADLFCRHYPDLTDSSFVSGEIINLVRAGYAKRLLAGQLSELSAQDEEVINSSQELRGVLALISQLHLVVRG